MAASSTIKKRGVSLHTTIETVLRLFVGIVSFPVLAVGSAVLYYKRRDGSSLVMLVGFMIALAGGVMQTIAGVPSHPVSYAKDASGRVIVATVHVPAIWSWGSAAFSIGIIVVMVGFLWLALAEPKTRGPN